MFCWKNESLCTKRGQIEVDVLDDIWNTYEELVKCGYDKYYTKKQKTNFFASNKKFGLFFGGGLL